MLYPPFDRVGDDRVGGARQFGDALDLHPGGARAPDPRPHRREQGREVDDLGLARRVLDPRRPLGERRGHHEVLGPRDGNEIGGDPRRLEPARSRHDVPVLDRDLGAEAGEPLEVLVDRPDADGAAARQGDARRAVARDERPEHEHGGPHRRDEFVRRDVVGDTRHLRRELAPLAPDGRAERLDQPHHRAHVDEVRDIRQMDRLRGQERRRQRGQRSVLGRAHPHRAAERYPTVDLEPRGHQALPATNRSTPARSARMATWTQPSVRRSAAAAVAWTPPAVSTTSTPEARRARRALAAILLISARPSAPPSSATTGSWVRTSGGSSGTSPVRRYGGLLTMRSAPRSRTPSSRSVATTLIRAASPRAFAFSRATAAAAGDTSMATTSRSGRSAARAQAMHPDRKSTRLNSSHLVISYAVFCLKKKKKTQHTTSS